MKKMFKTATPHRLGLRRGLIWPIEEAIETPIYQVQRLPTALRSMNENRDQRERNQKEGLVNSDQPPFLLAA